MREFYITSPYIIEHKKLLCEFSFTDLFECSKAMQLFHCCPTKFALKELVKLNKCAHIFTGTFTSCVLSIDVLADESSIRNALANELSRSFSRKLPHERVVDMIIDAHLTSALPAYEYKSRVFSVFYMCIIDK